MLGRLFRRSGRAPAGSVVFLGDSLTEQWPAADRWLFRAGRVCRGIGGETTAGLRARFETDVVAARPACCHIMGGTNDLWHGHPGHAARGALANLGAMIDRAGEAGIAIVIAPPPPIAPAALPLLGHPELYDLLKHGIELLAHQSGAVLVDYARALADKAGRLRPAFTTDGIHLTRRGYLAMRADAERAIQRALARRG